MVTTKRRFGHVDVGQSVLEGSTTEDREYRDLVVHGSSFRGLIVAVSGAPIDSIIFRLRLTDPI